METTRIKERLVHSARHTAAGLNQLLWPSVCSNCSEAVYEGQGSLCSGCWDEFIECTCGDYCRRCGRNASSYGIVGGECAHCRDKEFAFDGIARVGVYAESLQQMILKFKNGGTELGSMLGRMASSALQGSSFYNEVEMLVPVPLHWTRRLIRGYNQTAILAKKVRQAGMKINTELVRIRRTRMQPVMASDAARRRNVAGAFAVRHRHRFAGRVVCLVDDIKTTGATLNECARVLKEAGAIKVYALVLAVAGQKAG